MTAPRLTPAELPAKYEQARKMLADLVKVDEVKDIRDKACAMEVYARQAKDTSLMDHATDIRLRAERRAGELLTEMAATGERAVRKNMKSQGATSKLADLGVTKSQSSRWQKLASLDEAAFDLKVSDAKRIAVASVEGNREIIREARKAQQDAKRARRVEREAALAAKVLALPEKKYGVIVEDYEWDQQTWSEDGKDRHASNPYPTSTDAHTADEIVERTKDRFSCAADDCVLFIWTTSPHLAIAIDVLRRRGFAYKSNHIWGKDRFGTGYWNRNKHEQLLIGVRGNVPCPAQGDQWDSLIIMAPVGKHSAKPECFLEMIEQYFPNVPKIELNRRGLARPGWDAWGNQIVSESPADLVDDDRFGIPDFLRRNAKGSP